MKTKHFPVIIEQDADGTFLVECPVFKGCRSYGNSIDEAINNIKEAIEVCLEDEVGLTDLPIFVGVRDLELTL